MQQSDPPVKRALLSVSDKDGLIAFASALAERNIELISTGGTARALKEAGLKVRDISDLTGFPEMMDGRLKTLHPRVHGGLLAVRGNKDHAAAQAEHHIADIDLLAVNLYPFEQTVAAGADFDTILENIDIGGPAMIRAAAKNWRSVTVIVDNADYPAVLEELAAGKGATSTGTRKRLAAKAYARTAQYDAAIAAWFAGQTGDPAPAVKTLSGRLVQTLRYGENPHQSAALYAGGTARPGVVTARQVQGKPLSYNNINDTDAAFECVSEFDPEIHAAVAIIKHANPCGAAIAETPAQAYDLALRCDPTSAFGGIIALNRTLDGETAKRISEIFTEVIIAPDADEPALEILAAKKNLRVLLTDGLPDPANIGETVKSISGGFLLQTGDNAVTDGTMLNCVTKRAPGDKEVADLIFAFKICKHVKSNAIVYARNGATAGIGAGQMSRVDSAMIAARKSAQAAKQAGLDAPLAKGGVVASDAFFPFPDGLLQAAEAGVTAVIQPGGSIRDDEVIEAADQAGLAMVFTGVRHFRH
jgi:phosphoribosylaminoimidazolecarboxamide formyltransferase/IMP cyclohydrolase